MVKAINAVIGVAIDGINALIRAYNAIPLLPNIPTISKPTLSTPTISAPSMPSVSTKLPTISTGSTNTSSGTSGGGVSTAVKSAASAAASTSGGNYQFGTSGVNTNTLAGIMAASGTSITVNVSGAIDKEGTARTIVDTLNNSYYRGTGGASNLQIA